VKLQKVSEGFAKAGKRGRTIRKDHPGSKSLVVERRKGQTVGKECERVDGLYWRGLTGHKAQ